MRVYRHTFICLCLIGHVLIAQDLPEAARGLLDKHTADLETFEADAKAKLVDMNKKYLISLLALEKQFADAGNLDGVIAVREERKQANLEKLISSSVPEQPLPLKSLRLRLEIGMSRYTAWVITQKNSLNKATRTRLQAMQVELTKAGDINAALAIKKAHEKLGKEQAIPPIQRAAPANTTGRTTGGTAARISPNGLVLYLPFDTPTPTDRSASRLQVENHGATFEAKGKKKGAFRFNGKDSFVMVHPDANLKRAGDLSVAAWVKLDPVTGHNSVDRIYIVASHSHPLGETRNFVSQGFSMYADTKSQDELCASTVYSVGPPVRSYAREAKVELTTSKWMHLLAIRKGSEVTVYANGEALNRGLTTGSQSDQKIEMLTPWYIGDFDGNNRTYGGGQNNYNVKGLIDEVMVFNRALSEAEISWFAEQAR